MSYDYCQSNNMGGSECLGQIGGTAVMNHMARAATGKDQQNQECSSGESELVTT